MQIISCGFAARNGGLQEIVVFFFDKGHQVGIVLNRDYHHHLFGILNLIWVLHDVKQPAGLDRDDDALKRQSASGLQRVVLFGIPPERLHMSILPLCVPFVTTSGERRITFWSAAGPRRRLHSRGAGGASAAPRVRQHVSGEWRVPCEMRSKSRARQQDRLRRREAVPAARDRQEQRRQRK